MKQLLYILLGITLFTSCSSDDDPVLPEPTQDYTSFTVVCESDFTVYNCVIGYKGADDKWIRIAALGDIKGKTESKEVKVDFSKVKEVYVFEEAHKDGVYVKTTKIPNAFILKENIKNKLVIPYSRSADNVNTDNPNQYPQE